MNIVNRMEANLTNTWKKAMDARTSDERNRFMAMYLVSYRKYKKQKKFSDALREQISKDVPIRSEKYSEAI